MTQTVRTLTAAIAGGLIVAVVGGAWGQTQPLTTTPVVDPTTAPVHTLSVNGSGTVTIVPDIAMVSLGVTVDRPTVEAARTEAARVMTGIVAAARDHGVAAKDIATTNVSLSPRYGPDCAATGSVVPCPSNGKVVGYTMSESVRVTIRDLAKVGAVIDAATGAGATNVYGIDLTVDDPAAASAQAREKAIADARSKADAMARAAGVSVVGIISISEGASTQPISPYAGKAAADSVGTPIEPGTLDVAASVSMVFELP